MGLAVCVRGRARRARRGARASAARAPAAGPRRASPTRRRQEPRRVAVPARTAPRPRLDASRPPGHRAHRSTGRRWPSPATARRRRKARASAPMVTEACRSPPSSSRAKASRARPLGTKALGSVGDQRSGRDGLGSRVEQRGRGRRWGRGRRQTSPHRLIERHADVACGRLRLGSRATHSPVRPPQRQRSRRDRHRQSERRLGLRRHLATRHPAATAAGSGPGSTALKAGLVPVLGAGSSGLPLQAGYAPSSARRPAGSEGISQTPNGGGSGGRSAQAGGGGADIGQLEPRADPADVQLDFRARSGGALELLRIGQPADARQLVSAR